MFCLKLKEKSKVGEDVKTFRVCEGEITLVEEITGQFLIKNTDSADIDAEAEAAGLKEEGDKDDEDSGDFRSSLKSRKAFQTQLNDKTVPGPVRNLQYVANIVMLIFIALSIIEYSIVRSSL